MVSFNRVDPILQEHKTRIDDLDYEFREDLIAEYPVEPRHNSRMLVINRESKQTEHRQFSDLKEFLEAGDVLVVNNTRVFPAILQATKEDTGDPIEVFLIRELDRHLWDVRVSPPRKVRIGNSLTFQNRISCDVIDNTVNGGRVVKFYENGRSLRSSLEDLGMMPLPPYIKRDPAPEDQRHYQTIFAEKSGSVAPPSAGLHFTEEVIEELEVKGVKVVPVTLHIGLGAYDHIEVTEVAKHSMHAEKYSISPETAETINTAHENGNMVIAAGSSVVRALETSQFEKQVIPKEGWTDLFIYPPFHFRIVDALISNFHEPRSVSLLLQSAFYNVDDLLSAYREATDEEYNFLSFGDGMLLH